MMWDFMNNIRAGLLDPTESPCFETCRGRNVQRTIKQSRLWPKIKPTAPVKLFTAKSLFYES